MLRPALVSILVLLASTSIRAQDVDVRFLPGDLLVSNGFERAPDGGSFWSRESSRIARRVDITSGLSIAGPLIARYDGAAVAMAWRASLWNERRRPVRRPTPPVLPPSPERYTWKFDKYAVGLNATGGGNDPALAVEMPDIIVLPDGRFRMYYAGPLSPSVSGARHAIKSAVSADGLNWTVESGIRLLGDGDGDGGPDGAPANEGVVNGPRVIRLSDGTYRMYYQANTLGFIPPDYRVKSATSTDGLTFAREGTRVDIHYPGGGPGQFSLAAHCAVIRVADDDFVILVSGNFDGKLGPSDLVIGTSSDGLEFSNYRVLYADGHDPFVLKLADGSGYRLFYGDLLDRQRNAVSVDGKSWTAVDQTLDTIMLNKAGNEVTEASAEVPSDRTALELDSGEILLFVVWVDAPPITNIALLRQLSPAVKASTLSFATESPHSVTTAGWR